VNDGELAEQGQFVYMEEFADSTCSRLQLLPVFNTVKLLLGDKLPDISVIRIRVWDVYLG
jgi:hypothetical protein